MLPQNIPNDDTNIFCRRVQIAEFYGVQIQVLVVEAVFNFIPDQVGEPTDIYHHTRFGVDFADHFYFQFVVVPVSVRVVAQAEHCLVFFIAPGGIVQAVCGVEMGFANNGDFQVLSFEF